MLDFFLFLFLKLGFNLHRVNFTTLSVKFFKFWKFITCIMTTIIKIQGVPIHSKFASEAICSQHFTPRPRQPVFCHYGFTSYRILEYIAFFHLAKWIWNPSLLLCVSVLCSIPVYGYTTVYLSSHQLKDCPNSGQLWLKLFINICIHVFLWICFYFNGKILRMRFLDCMVNYVQPCNKLPNYFPR